MGVRRLNHLIPKLPEALIKAHAEAIKRFYDDKAFAVKAYLAWDKQEQGEIERVYDHYSKVNTYERAVRCAGRSANAGIQLSNGYR